MKRTALLGLLFLVALLFTTGCARFVTSGGYTLESGQTLQGNLVATSGVLTLKEGSRVTGSVIMTSGTLNADGIIEGDVLLTSGTVNLGPKAVVQGNINATSGRVNRADGSRVEGQVTSRGALGSLLGILIVPILLVVALTWLLTYLGRRPPTPASQTAAGAIAPAGGERRGNAAPIIGAVLVILGLLFFAQQFINVDLGDYLWPFFIIVPGLLFFVAMVAGGRSAGGLAIPGSIITMVGLILLGQNLTGWWQSWAYAWALIFPTAVGLGMLIQGWWSGEPHLFQTGLRFVAVGLGLFAVFAIFFELVLGIGGFGGLGSVLFPLLLIVAGVFLLFGRRLFGGPPTASPPPPFTAPPPPPGERPIPPDDRFDPTS